MFCQSLGMIWDFFSWIWWTHYKNCCRLIFCRWLIVSALIGLHSTLLMSWILQDMKLNLCLWQGIYLPTIVCEKISCYLLSDRLCVGCSSEAMTGWCYLRGRIVVQVHHIWPGSCWPGCCHPLGSGGGVGPPHGWCRSGPQTRAGRSLSCHRAWGIQSVYNP